MAQSTDASRGKIGFRQGRHAWEVIWEGPLGTVAVIGISTKEASLQCHGYVALLGLYLFNIHILMELSVFLHFFFLF